MIIYISNHCINAVILKEKFTLCDNYRHAVLVTDSLCYAETEDRTSGFNTIDVIIHKNSKNNKTEETIKSANGKTLKLNLTEMKRNVEFRKIEKIDEPYKSKLNSCDEYITA